MPIMVEIGKEMTKIENYAMEMSRSVVVRRETYPSFMYFKDAQMIFCAARTIIIIIVNIIRMATFCSFNSFQHSV